MKPILIHTQGNAMRWLVLAGMSLSVVSAFADEKTRLITFAKSDNDKLPTGWTAAKTGEGEGSVWKVAADDTAPGKTGHVLVQTAKGPTRLFNLCLLDGATFADGELSVAVKSNKGDIDQGGGLVWRCQDANNYYVCRYNPLEGNFRLYYLKDGRRTQLATKENVELSAGKWFTVGVRHAGNKIECSLNGDKLLTVTDDTFLKPGKIGLWTKADAVSAFDQLSIKEVAK
jgi:hypothetical protein